MNQKTKINIKQFKCQECGDYLPKFKVESTRKRLVDARKYYKTKVVCERCFNRLRNKFKPYLYKQYEI